MDMAAPIADDHHAESKVGTWLRKSWMTPNTCLVVYLCFLGGTERGVSATSTIHHHSNKTTTLSLPIVMSHALS